ncbi:MAG: fasciclin domain-containing protein [Muribaculaceae bacterium]|nr:fasciclin domain-containing protein [Muribaculaceae bacterium]
MKLKTSIHVLFVVVPLLTFSTSCTEDIDTSDRYTFTGKTVVDYLRDFPESYSEYSALLDSVQVSDFSQSTMSQLLSARGNYTCFAPTNEAIQLFLDSLATNGVISEPTWDAPEFWQIDPETKTRKLLDETRKTIVYNSLIDGGDDVEAYLTSDISERAEENQMLGLPNMRDRKLMCSVGNGTKYAINGSNISDTNCDIYAINGRIHQVDKVIAPNTQTANEFFEKLVDDKVYGFYTFATLVDACGLGDILNESEENTYYSKRMTGELENLAMHPGMYLPGYLPERRYIGYTIFAEDDSWWETALGLPEGTITELAPQELVEKVAGYVTDNNLALSTAHAGTDYTDEDNALNQFVTYHILPGKLETSKLVIHFCELYYNLTDRVKGASVFDFYTTLGKRRLLKTYEASKTCDGKRNTIYLNRFPVLKNGRGKDQNYTEVSCDDAKKGVEIYTSGNPEMYNAYLYRISDCLYYNDEQAITMASERVRIDFSTIFPEMMTNDIRSNENYTAVHQVVGFPVSNKYQYLENCDISDQTRFYYLSGRISDTQCWHNYEGDELNIVGNYEVTFKLPPVPKDGIYELRLGISTFPTRGMCQVYWGNDKANLPATGLPVDMRMGGTVWYVKGGTDMESILGYEEDVEGDDELNAENDRKMRNNGAMKAPNSYYQFGSSVTMRSQNQGKVVRRIIVREEMKADEVYYLRLKSVLRDPDTQLYLDYLEYCPKEVYDNPLVPEDIW